MESSTSVDIPPPPNVDASQDVSEENNTTMFKMPILTPMLTAKRKFSAAAKVFSDSDTKVISSEADGTKDSQAVTSNKKNKKTKGFSPAEQLKESEAIIPYKEPAWGGISDRAYYFEVVKNGAVVDQVDLSIKSYFVFGRLPSCDHAMDHPSLSRHHAIIQHCVSADSDRQVGWYLYDLDSTHGTWINKNKVTPSVYHRLRVGYVVKFGGSSRLYILQGPDTDQDEEAELSVAELKAQRERQKKEAEVLRQVDAAEAEDIIRRKMQAQQDVGCTWGFGDDAEDANSDDDNTVLPAPLQEELYIEDPKKALRGFFEREGWDFPEYEFLDEGKGKHTCRVEIPIDTPTGQPVVAEVTQTGSRKDAVVACALEACRILDRHGLLRQATHESRAKKAKNWEDADFYDSDEDTFLDRTGDIEKKRQKRILRVKPFEKKTENFETLSKRLEEVQSELSATEARLEQDKADKQAMEDDGLDALDAFMMSIKSGGLDTKTRMDLKRRSVELRQQKLQLERLLKIAKPCSLPTMVNIHNQRVSESNQPAVKGASLPIFGKIKTAAVIKPVHKEISVHTSDTDSNDIEEEEEEDDVDESNGVGDREKRLISDTADLVPAELSIKPVVNKSSVKDVTSNDLMTVIETSDTQTVGQHQPLEKSGSTMENKERKRKIHIKKAASLTTSQSAVGYKDTDPNYAVWVPPENQSGDGRTHLNEKFGY